MSDESAPSWSSYNQIKEESIERRLKIKELEARIKEIEAEYAGKIESLTAERDEARSNADEIAQAYERFTSENELHKENETLRGKIRDRELFDTISKVEGVKLHEGVSLTDLANAAGIDMPGLDEELPEDWATQLVEQARAKKPYLFASQEQVNGTNGADAPRETAVQPQRKAFGSQAVGGGATASSPAKDPAKAVDWSNPVAVLEYNRATGNG
jgi:hypothetical protein